MAACVDGPLHPGYVKGKCIGCGKPMPGMKVKAVREEKPYVKYRPVPTMCTHPIEAHYTAVICGEEAMFCNFCTERVD